MPPGNICAVVGCNSKKKEGNVTSFTLPNSGGKDPVTSPKTQESKEVSRTLPSTQSEEAPTVLADTQTDKQTRTALPDNQTQIETSVTTPVLAVESSLSLNKEEPATILTETIAEISNEISNDQESEESFNKMPLQLTKPAPQFKTTAVVNGEFKDISLSDYKGKYVVLFFYPLDFTFVCPTEIIAFSEHADDFRKIGCEVIAASTDSHFTHLAWINTPRKQGGLGPMNIPILSDKSHRIARDYGVLDEETGIPFRGLFIIDEGQRLRQVTVNDLPVGRSVDETLRLVQAFQYTDKYGEVCPANWTPGSKTIKPDTKAAKEYFGETN